MSGIESLTTTPDEPQSKSHYHCDFIELLSLVANGDLVSGEDVLTRYTNYDNKLASDMPKEYQPDLNDEDEERQGQIKYAEVSEQWEKNIHDWFSILSARSAVYGDAYPFTVNLHRHQIQLKSSLGVINQAYIFLLLCSSLKYFDKSAASKLTTDFESMSFYALKKYLPSNSIVHKFGKSNNANERYKGNITAKIELLASDLKKQKKIRPHFFVGRNSGDLGIDLVSWTPFEQDKIFNYIHLLFAQCGSGKNWLDKQKEPVTAIKNCIDGVDNPACALFIPYDARNADRQYCEEAFIDNDILLFDRLRILFLLKDSLEFIHQLPSYCEVIKPIASYRESIV